DVWQSFLAYKLKKDQLSKKEAAELERFIENEDYLKVTETFSFDYPHKKYLSKTGSSKKRTVYTYSKNETWVLKLLAYLLYKYDDRISASCYSFRKNKTSKSAFDAILKIRDLDEKYVLKADIHDYFNSIDVIQLVGVLKEIIDDDEELLHFLEELLTQDKCYFNGELIEEKRGAMAGVPLASFFANIYLQSLDRLFEEKGIPYLRYSDDIIIFADSEEERETAYGMIVTETERKKLALNPDKLLFSDPHEGWEFLGFSYKEGIIDMSAVTVKKMKGKIRRKARNIYRWKERKDRTFREAARAMIRSFDHRFYDLSGSRDFTWIRFYFPLINTDKGLHEIDEYMQMYLRYLYSGRHYKGNYRVEYEDLKKLGYTPLVAEYHRWKKDNAVLDKKNRLSDDMMKVKEEENQ
ncbi:MAG: hypothetical protein IKE38_06040, partial [Erysipelotrichaceae bacterium]|nr:hypothetical protein [Erysipelotrichaceae bacterium]